MPAETTENLDQLLRRESALRRVATLVAQGAGPERLFDAVAAEASLMIGVDAISLIRWDAATGTFTLSAATHGPRAALAAGGQSTIDISPLGRLIVQTGRAGRVDDWTHFPGPVAARHREEGFGQAAGAPIVVNGSIWGYIAAFGEAGETLPPGCETRLADFTQLMATAIANAQAHDDLRDLAESQGALRRVATLVAQGAEPGTVFSAVAVEAARMLRVGAVSLIRYDAQTGMLTKIFGTHGNRAAVPDGGQWTLDDGPEAAMIVRTGRPVRIDDWTAMPGPVAARHVAQGFGQAVAAPVVIDGALWGLVAAFGEAGEILPPGSETRLADFTNLMASAISNAQARDELRGLAEQQGAALRRVATLVAQQAPPDTIFTAVAREASRALRVQRVVVARTGGRDGDR